MASPQETLLRQMMTEVKDKLTENLRVALADTIEQQISTSLTQALLESQFYRHINKDMRSGLKQIYKEISVVVRGQHSGEGIMDRARAAKLFHETSEQLSAVLRQTESATEQIMEVVERNMDIQARMDEILQATDGPISPEERDWMCSASSQMQTDLNSVLVALSFQDLTGQRIKRAVKALQEIESTVVELYLSTGLLIQAYEEAPDKNLDTLQEEAQRTVKDLKNQILVGSELKGPTSGVTQKQIDDLLSQLGMD